MATKAQQYTGRLYTQAEVDRMVREARMDELDHIDASQHTVTTAIGGDKVHIFDRMEELKQELKEES